METNQEKRQPEGSLILRTLAMPSDTNANGDIFGGWIMSQMDMGGGNFSERVGKRACGDGLCQ